MEHVQAGQLIVGSEIELARQVDASVEAGWLCGGRGTSTAAEFGLAAAGQGVRIEGLPGASAAAAPWTLASRRPALAGELLLEMRDSRCFVRSSATKSAGSARGLPRRQRQGKDRSALLPRWAFHGVRAVTVAQLSHAHLIPKRASLVVWSTLGTCLEHGCSGGRIPRTSK